MFLRKRIVAVMLVGALLGVSGLAPAQASAAHSRVIGPLPAQAATLSMAKRVRRRRRSRVRTVISRIGVRVPSTRAVRPGLTAIRSWRPFLNSFARGPPRPQNW
jgi:hypothetical protein